jgi:ribosomal protein L3 glutamine methyltransferase
MVKFFSMNTKLLQEAVSQLTSAGDWVRWAATCFNKAGLWFGHGTESAWDEAVNLVLTALNLPPDISAEVFHATLIDTERQEIAKLIKERVETRKPLAYLLKQAWFYGKPFYVDERVLIPRSPIAEWLEKQFIPWIDPDRVGHILEIGTGSGCIAIGAAWSFPEAYVDAVDISPEALAVAAINIAHYQLEDRVFLHQSDCFADLPLKKYDIILSNPPYVGKEEYDDLPPEYFHEPRSALLAGEDGLDVVKKILAGAKQYLAPEGILIIEVGNTESTFMEHFPHLAGVWLELERGGQGILLLTAEQL